MNLLVVATTAGYALSVLRPRYARLLTGLLLTTLFVPAVVLLVPLYIEIVHPPIVNHSFIDSYWAVWLPAGASAFNVILVKRFFDNLPRELFEAAQLRRFPQIIWRTRSDPFAQHSVLLRLALKPLPALAHNGVFVHPRRATATPLTTVVSRPFRLSCFFTHARV